MAKKKCCADRLNKVGGQAVLEGVMMKAGTRTVTTCRKSDGSLVVTDGEFQSARKKNKFLNLPLVRGVVNMIEMLKLSYTTLSASADALGLDEEDEKAKARREKREAKRIAKGKPPKKKKKESSLTDGVMVVSLILGILLAIGLFLVLPGFAAEGVNWIYRQIYEIVDPVNNLNDLSDTLMGIIEGVSKVIIFVAYLFFASLLKDIKRTFMYHGAEHKSIACFEAGEELTPENAKKHRRFHPRCGTSFMFVMILLGVLAGIIINNLLGPTFRELLGGFGARIALISVRLLILPLLVGIGYEFIMFAGKHDNFITRALSAPGLWMQRITTKEPTESMLEVAIVSIKCALRDEYPEFKEFYENRAWEKKPADEENKEKSTDTKCTNSECAECLASECEAAAFADTECECAKIGNEATVEANTEGAAAAVEETNKAIAANGAEGE